MKSKLDLIPKTKTPTAPANTEDTNAPKGVVVQ